MIANLRRCRRVLVVAPHSDDEAIGAYGLLNTLRGRGAVVWVLIVSDGAASHPGSARWPVHRLVLERRRETRRAMATLGIPPSRIRFLGLPDGQLSDCVDRVRDRCGRAMRRMPPSDLIVVPVVDDDHPDHRAVAAALASCRTGAQLGYRVWPLQPAPRCRLTLPLGAGTQAAKRRVVRSYRTQSARVADTPTGMAMTARHLRYFAGPVERFRVLR